jgi:hypothetical protein
MQENAQAGSTAWNCTTTTTFKIEEEVICCCCSYDQLFLYSWTDATSNAHQ